MELWCRRREYRGRVTYEIIGGNVDGRAFYNRAARQYVASVKINLPNDQATFREARAGTMLGAINRLVKALDKESIGLFYSDRQVYAVFM